MFSWIEANQMNIMLVLCAICAMMVVLLILTKYLSKRRKMILILMELIASFLIGFDRAAYLYKGDMSLFGSVMVRLSNFMVFFLTSAIVFGFNFYLCDLLEVEGGMKKIPRRLIAAYIGAAIGMALSVISAFTGLYYTIDANNQYHRGPGFLLCYAVPILMPFLQFSVVWQRRKAFSRLIFTSLLLYIFVPILIGIIQIFAYGVSIVNMSMVLVSISLYLFAYLDINDEVERSHVTEVRNLEKEQRSMRRLFDQTANAFVSAAEMNDGNAIGHSKRVADYAKRLALEAGKSEKEADEIYYAALLHDVGHSAGDSAKILSLIAEYPYLGESARYLNEHYDGTGEPNGLKGDEIPEMSRIIAVAKSYDSLRSNNGLHNAVSYPFLREEFVKEAGLLYDPVYADLMVQIMDRDYAKENDGEMELFETELICNHYRDSVSIGIPIAEEKICVRFQYEKNVVNPNDFSEPAIIIFDSYDRRVHNSVKAIEEYRYLEYGECWYNGRYVSTAARNMEVKVTERKEQGAENAYMLTCGRYEDHIAIAMDSPTHHVDVVVALPDNSKSSYLGLTGEHCMLKDILVESMDEWTTADSIPKIVGEISYINRIEADLPNLQVDKNRSASTKGIEIKNVTQFDFHTMSLPSANLVWHCPYLVLYHSDDGRIGGPNYREYGLIKLNGEGTGDEKLATNHFTMKKTDEFPGWEQWKKLNKLGRESYFRIVKKGNKIITTTYNLGIEIENTTQVLEDAGKVYAALTGDQVALTDIRIVER